MPFDAKDPEQVKKLQTDINAYLEVSGRKYTPLQVSGSMDDATKAAWKQVKSETYTDGQISTGYLKDNLKLDDAGLKALGIDNPKKFDRAHPPQAAIDAVSAHLGLSAGTQYDSTDFQNAVKKDKRANWIDDRVTDAAISQMQKSIQNLIQSKTELSEITNGFPTLAKGDAGTGVALLQHYFGLETDGIAGKKTAFELELFQQHVNEQRAAEGLPAITVDRKLGFQTYLALKADGFDLAKQKTELETFLAEPEHTKLAPKLQKDDTTREALFEAKQKATGAGLIGGSHVQETQLPVVRGNGESKSAARN